MYDIPDETLPAGVGVIDLIAEVLTRLSRLTRAEFSPRNDCGVFLTAPVLVGRVSAMLPKSNGSGDTVFTVINKKNKLLI